MHTLTISEKQYPVKFTLRSLKEYERLTGRSLLSEDYRKIFSLELGVDCLTGFVYAGLVGAVNNVSDLTLTVNDLEQQLGFNTGQYEGLVQAYIDFVPGLRKIYNRILNDSEFAKKVEEADGDEEKLKAIYLQLLESPNGQPQAVTT